METRAGFCRFGSHECFAYRVLKTEFTDLVEVFGSVIDLCGTKELGCPSSSSPSLSPDPVFTRLPSRSQEPNKVTWMTDFVSEEDLDAVIAEIAKQESARMEPKVKKRTRAASHNSGRGVVRI